MITKDDLLAAIAECKGERSPNANTCFKLAAYYIIMREEFGEQPPSYSYTSAPAPDSVIDYYSDTEFGQAIEGKPLEYVMQLIDELMETLKIVNKRLYNGVMSHLQ